jgi:hypothetical protein
VPELEEPVEVWAKAAGEIARAIDKKRAEIFITIPVGLVRTNNYHTDYLTFL